MDRHVKNTQILHPKNVPTPRKTPRKGFYWLQTHFFPRMQLDTTWLQWIQSNPTLRPGSGGGWSILWKNWTLLGINNFLPLAKSGSQTFQVEGSGEGRNNAQRRLEPPPITKTQHKFFWPENWHPEKEGWRGTSGTPTYQDGGGGRPPPTKMVFGIICIII